MGPLRATPSKITSARARCWAAVIRRQEAYAFAANAPRARVATAVEMTIRVLIPLDTSQRPAFVTASLASEHASRWTAAERASGRFEYHSARDSAASVTRRGTSASTAGPVAPALPRTHPRLCGFPHSRARCRRAALLVCDRRRSESAPRGGARPYLAYDDRATTSLGPGTAPAGAQSQSGEPDPDCPLRSPSSALTRERRSALLFVCCR